MPSIQHRGKGGVDNFRPEGRSLVGCQVPCETEGGFRLVDWAKGCVDRYGEISFFSG